MTLITAIRSALPAAIKAPLRNYVDTRALRRQSGLKFAGLNLRSARKIDLQAIMGDAAIGSAFAEDHARIAAVCGSGEIGGGVNPGDRRALYHLTAHFKPKRVLEIGTHVAMSTAYLASALQRFVDGGELTTVDIVDVNGPRAAWQEFGMAAPPATSIAALGLNNIVRFVTKPALEVFRTQQRFDLVFLDGDHSPAAVYREISAALQIVNPEGLIVLHDFYPGGQPLMTGDNVIRGPSSAADRIQSETRDLAFIPLGALPWPTKRGGNVTSLALVAKAG